MALPVLVPARTWRLMPHVLAAYQHIFSRMRPLESVLLLLRIVIALTVGLAQSRAPFEYIRLHGLACLALVFAVPSIIILAYQLRARCRK